MSQPTSSGQIAAGERENAQVSRLLTWLSATAIAFLVGIGAKAWLAGHTTHAWVLWSFIGLIGLNMLYFANTRNQTRQKGGLIVIVGLLFTYLIASGGESNTGPLWFYVFPPLLFYLTDLKTGTAVLLFCYLIAVVVFQFPGLPLVAAEYSMDFKIRFFATSPSNQSSALSLRPAVSRPAMSWWHLPKPTSVRREPMNSPRCPTAGICKTAWPWSFPATSAPGTTSPLP